MTAIKHKTFDYSRRT